MVEFAMVIYLNQECLQNASLDTCVADPSLRNEIHSYNLNIPKSPKRILCHSNDYLDEDHEK